MSRSFAFLPAAALAAAVFAAAGCASSPPGSPEREKDATPFTRMPGSGGWVTARQVAATDVKAVVVGVVDFDFSGRDVAILYSPATYRPDPSGAVDLLELEPPVRLRTAQELRDALARRTEETPVGLVVLSGGRPVGLPSEPIPDSLRDFLVGFDGDLRLAGVSSVYLLPVSFSFARVPDGGEEP